MTVKSLHISKIILFSGFFGTFYYLEWSRGSKILAYFFRIFLKNGKFTRTRKTEFIKDVFPSFLITQRPLLCFQWEEGELITFMSFHELLWVYSGEGLMKNPRRDAGSINQHARFISSSVAVYL